MIFRPFTLVCFGFAAYFGWNLFQVKNQTAALDRELAGVAEQIKTAQKQKETLESVWGTLNDLPRLRQLSQQLLPMETSQTPQNRSFAELERRLPPAQAFDGTRSAFAPRDGVSAPDVALALLPPEASRPAAAPAPVALAPVALAAAGVAAAAPMAAPATPQLVAAAMAPVADALVEEEVLPLPPPAPPHLLALAEPRLTPVAAPRPAPPKAALPAVAAPAYAAASGVGNGVGNGAGMATPIAYGRPQAPRPLPAPVAPEAPARSMLGGLGAPMLAPPVPYGSANAASYGGYAR